MDYYCYFNYFIFIFFLFLQNSNCTYERDIILTPNKIYQQKGKILYYNENNDKQNQRIPWENILKYTIYMVLNNKIDEENYNSSESSTIPKDLIDTAEYIKISNKNIPQFGDIITLAKGRLEKTDYDKYLLIEMNMEHCIRHYCPNLNDDNHDTDNHNNNDANGKTKINKNIITYWIIEKIRHHYDDITTNKSLYRYELKITIFPLLLFNHKTTSYREHNNNNNNNKPETLLFNKSKSFILKDIDYPKYFSSSSSALPLTTTSTTTTTAASSSSLIRTTRTTPSIINPNQLQRRTFNIIRPRNFMAQSTIYDQIPSYYLNYFKKPILNTGEYFLNPSILLANENENHHNNEEYFPVATSGTKFSSSPSSNHHLFYNPNYYKHQYQQQELIDDGEEDGEQGQPLHHIRFPLTNYDHIQFPTSTIVTEPPLSLTTPQSLIPTTTHYHHHYYLNNKNKLPIYKTTQYENQQISPPPHQQQQDFTHFYQQHQSTLPNNIQSSPTSAPQSFYQNLQDASHIGIPIQVQLITPPSKYHHQHQQGLQQYYQQQQQQQQQQNLNQQHHLAISHIFTPISPESLHPRYNQQQQQPENIANTNELYSSKLKKYSEQLPKNLHYSEPDPIYHSIPEITEKPNLIINSQQQEHNLHNNDVSLPPPSLKQTTSVSSSLNLSKPSLEVYSIDENTSDNNDNVNIDNDDDDDDDDANDNDDDGDNNYSSENFNNYQSEESNTNKNNKNFPDSINAQLPQPNSNDNIDLTVPYVETSVITQKSVAPPHHFYLKQNIKKFQSTNTTNEKKFTPSTVITKPTTNDYQIKRTSFNNNNNRLSSFIRTTEKPILKWMPKKNANNFNNKNAITTASSTTLTVPSLSITDISSATAPISTTTTTTTTNENIITITPTYYNEEPRTKLSISKSISYKINNNNNDNFVDNSNFIKSTTPLLNNENPQQLREDEFVSATTNTAAATTPPTSTTPSDSSQNLFTDGITTTTTNPNFEMIKAELESITTNFKNLNIYKASDATISTTLTNINDGINNYNPNNNNNQQEDEDLNITMSIVNHASKL